MNKCEEELSNCKLQLTENQSQLSTVEAKVTLEQTKNSELKNELEMNKKAENEKIEILNLNLAEVKNVAETQKNELQYLKGELEKELIKKFIKILSKISSKTKNFMKILFEVKIVFKKKVILSQKYRNSLIRPKFHEKFQSKTKNFIKQFNLE